MTDIITFRNCVESTLGRALTPALKRKMRAEMTVAGKKSSNHEFQFHKMLGRERSKSVLKEWQIESGEEGIERTGQEEEYTK